MPKITLTIALGFVLLGDKNKILRDFWWSCWQVLNAEPLGNWSGRAGWWLIDVSWKFARVTSCLGCWYSSVWVRRALNSQVERPWNELLDYESLWAGSRNPLLKRFNRVLLPPLHGNPLWLLFQSQQSCSNCEITKGKELKFATPFSSSSELLFASAFGSCFFSSCSPVLCLSDLSWISSVFDILNRKLSTQWSFWSFMKRIAGVSGILQKLHALGRYMWRDNVLSMPHKHHPDQSHVYLAIEPEMIHRTGSSSTR